MTRQPQALAGTAYRSWGGTFVADHRVYRPRSIDEACTVLAGAGKASVLSYGNGRSYGDVALNPGGMLIDCRSLDRFVEFDRHTGIVTCEAGVTLADILAVLCRPEPDGSAWFLPVSPGTRFITVGGAIANDVHGKNHYHMGCFGRHVLGLELARSDGSVFACSRQANPDLFAATIGGLGLTGLILTARLQLRRVEGSAVEMEDVQFGGLAEFFALSEEAAEWDYAAAWIDCLARGRALGRGIYSRARHRPGNGAPPPETMPSVAVPLTLPLSPLNRLTLRAFNAAYFHRHYGRRRRLGSYEPFLYPLDKIGAWNRLYGPSGFFQFQCVVPTTVARETTTELLDRITTAGQGSLLAVLKMFDALPSPGLLSFPLPGATLALDFPNRGPPTRQLLGELETIVMAAGGRLYPAKDSTMRADSFWQGYPEAGAFLRYADPAMSSAFARRVHLRCGLDPDT